MAFGWALNVWGQPGDDVLAPLHQPAHHTPRPPLSGSSTHQSAVVMLAAKDTLLCLPRPDKAALCSRSHDNAAVQIYSAVPRCFLYTAKRPSGGQSGPFATQTFKVLASGFCVVFRPHSHPAQQNLALRKSPFVHSTMPLCAARRHAVQSLLSDWWSKTSTA